MEFFFTLLSSIGLMFLYMGIGYLLYKKKLITKDGSEQFGSLLLYVILPTAIFKAYQVEFTKERLIGLFISCLLSVISLIIAMLLSRMVFKKYPLEHFGSSFSNAGFIGIPLVSLTLGQEAVFYMASFVAFLNIFQWTYGVMVLTGNKKSVSVKALIKNPIILTTLISICFFIMPIQVPDLLLKAIETIAGMNAPIAMIILGTYLAQLKISEIFSGRITYLCVWMRLLVIPGITLLLLTLVPSNYANIKMAIMIAASAPVGSNVAIFAQRHKLDYTQAVKDVCLSTFLCLITIPLLCGIAEILWNH